jgi:ADP-ribose pyrophosphatase YjhB (NUDIX family)
MQHADVVTNFVLRRASSGGDELLLVRRSDRVGTYQGRWAGVSGFADSPPDEQAYVELWEETHLARGDVTLLRKGEPLTFVDEALGRQWTVHPYLFRVSDPAKLQTDWEATEARWIAPPDLDQYETVPMLKEAFQRVYPLDAPRESAVEGQ